MMIDAHLAQRIIGLAMEVPQTFSPGLLVSAHEEFLCIELEDANISYARQARISAAH